MGHRFSSMERPRPSPTSLVFKHLRRLRPTAAGARRRTISLRVFGDDVTCCPRPDQGIAEVDRLAADEACGDPIRILAGKPEGTPFRHPAFARIV